MSVPTDAELVRRVLGGDTPAYALLVNRYRERYVRYAAHMLGRREDAEEVVQDTFVRAYRALARYEEREQFRSWLFRILVNRCRTAGGRARRRRTAGTRGGARRSRARSRSSPPSSGRRSCSSTSRI